MRTKEQIWHPYLESQLNDKEQLKQKFESKLTSRKQIPRTAHILNSERLVTPSTILLDLGCGKFSDLMGNFVRSQGGVYYGIDPYNVTKEVNLAAIESCAGGKTDVVTISNVLNVIKEKEIQSHIIEQAHDALKLNGSILVVIYEGVRNKTEKQLEITHGVKTDMTPIITRDGFQQRKKTEYYLPVVKQFFPLAEIVTFNKNGGKAIIAKK